MGCVAARVFAGSKRMSTCVYVNPVVTQMSIRISLNAFGRPLRQFTSRGGFSSTVLWAI